MKKYALLFFYLLITYIPINAQISSTDTSILILDSIPQATDSMLLNELSATLNDLPSLSINTDLTTLDESGTISSLLAASRDPFYTAASFQFSPYRFQPRGYDNNWNNTYINNIALNGLDNGYTPFSLWRGLSKMMQNKNQSNGLNSNNTTFGNIGINTNIDMRAGSQRAQTNIQYTQSNRSFNNRIFASYSSGFNRNGWAYSIAASGTYARQGHYYIGTYDKSYSVYAAIDKRINLKNKISIISFYAPSEYARPSAAVKEAISLSGNNYYNPSWGYQNGKIRSSNIRKYNQPVILLNFETQPNNQSEWNTAVGYYWGKKSRTHLEWQNAPNPKPDYYRYLPSYYATFDEVQAETLKDNILANKNLLQIDWDNLYTINKSSYTTINNASGIVGNNVTGNQSKYILGSDIADENHFMFSSRYLFHINNIFSIAGGIHYTWQKNHYFQQVNDLLGGNFWLDINQYAEQGFSSNTYTQYDLNNPNDVKIENEHYGYDYSLTFNQAAIWWQTKITLKRTDIFWSNQLSYTAYYRTGNKKVGLFPKESFGKAAKNNFINNATKMGFSYKINGRNYLHFNAAYYSLAPKADAVYIAPRLRNTLQSELKSESIEAIETGYNLNTPLIQLSITGYFTKSQNGMDVLSFYDDQYNNYVNYALSKINKINFGSEIGTAVKLSSVLSINAAAAIGRYYYDSRQNATITIDNNATVIDNKTIYVKNYRIPSTPQEAYNLGLFYKSPKYWYISINGNYICNNYLSLNPLRRTADIASNINITEGANQLANILAQEKLTSIFSLNLFAGWSKIISKKMRKKPMYLILNLGINNLTNNRNTISGGYEQLRFDTKEYNINKFPPKYYYAYGINYFFNVGIRF